MHLSSNEFDVVVIGGGLGGLTAGAKLARAGKSVLLLEQHSVPGGCATTFRRKGFLMEAGLHEIDGLDPADPKRAILEELDVFKQIEFVRVPEFYRVVTSRTDLLVPDNIEQASEVLMRAFPLEEKGILAFFKTIQAFRAEVGRLLASRINPALLFPLFPVLYPHLVASSSRLAAMLFPLFPLLHPRLAFGNYRTVGDFVDGIIRDEELKLVLLANLGYYHDDPYSLALPFFSAAQASYYGGGGHFIKGGSQRLSDHLAGLISAQGGTVLLNALATRILTKDGRAAGVAFRRRNSGSGAEEVVRAGAVVGNAAVPVVEAMLPGPEQAVLRRRTAGMKPSCSLLTVYLGFRRDISVLNNKAYSTIQTGEGVVSLRQAASSMREGFHRRGFIFVDYSRIDSGLGAPGKSHGVITTTDYPEEWAGLEGGDYKKKKEQVARTLISRLEKLVPGLAGEIEQFEVGTARTVERYTLNPGGAVYGYAQIPSQAGLLNRLGNRSPVKNLYFASAWSMPGGGFSGAILSGEHCARAVLSSIGRK